MDLSTTVSPTWPEHYKRNWKDYGFSPLALSADGERMTETDVKRHVLNLSRVLSIPIGRFVSCLAFDGDLRAFLERFLMTRKRKGSTQLADLDVRVFIVYYRLVKENTMLSFTRGAGVTHLGELKLLTAKQLLRLGALYHRPGRPNDAFHELVINALDMFGKDLVRDIHHELKNASTTIVDAAASVRAIVETTVGHEFALLGYHDPVDTINYLTAWYGKSTADARECHHLAVLLALLLERVFVSEAPPTTEMVEHLLDLILESGTSDAGSIWSNHAENLCPLLNRIQAPGVDRVRIEYCVEYIKSSSSLGSTTRPSRHESWSSGSSEEAESPPVSASRIDQNNKPGNVTEQIKAVRDVVPHLGTYFIKRLLDAVDGDVHRAITCVLEDTVPNQLKDLDFSAEVAPVPTLTIRQPDARTVQDDQRNNNMPLMHDEVLKARIRAIVEDYEEYDDTRDGEFGIVDGSANEEELSERVVDPVDGKLRDRETGRVIKASEIDPVFRPNQNRSRPVVSAATELKPAQPLPPPPPPVLTATQEADKAKKDRQRQYAYKEKRGNKQRTKGSDRKMGTGG